MAADPDTRSASEPGGALAVLPLRGGEHVGRYVILYTLGRGGMGVVYAAYDPQLDRKLAIKLMRPRSNRSGRQSVLLQEAQTLARLSDPHVVAIHDVGVIGDRVFVAMDFVEGQTLRRWVGSAPRTVAEIVAVYRQAGHGLAAAHRAGIVHRDFKPDNAIVDKQGRVQVLDFGLARVNEAGAAAEAPSAHPRGTPMYMAPEQHQGGEAGPACDQFAFCVSLYEALYRRLPFPSDDAASAAEAILHGPVPDPPRVPGVSARLRRAVLKGLERRVDARHASMDALDDELRAATVRGRRRRLAATAGVVLGVGAAAWMIGRQVAPTPCTGAESRLDSTWNDTRVTAIATALAATGRTHAPQTHAQLRTIIDGFAERWNTAWRDACEATHVRHEQSSELLDLRMACLETRRERLDALLHLLGNADADIADHAVEAALALPEMTPCGDAPALRQGTPLPDDANVRAQIDELRMRLAHAEALDHAGKTADALAIAEVTATRALELHHAPLVAEAHLRLGSVLDTLGHAQRAEVALRRAALAAEDAGDDRLLADARIALVEVTGGRLEKLDLALLWAELARAPLDRLRHEARREALLEHNLAIALEHAGRPEDVLAHQRRALALASEPGAMDEVQRAPLYSSLAMTLSEVGLHDEALQRAEAGLAIWRGAYGEVHPRTAAALGAVGLVHDQRGDLATARQWYERSHASFVAALGRDNPRSADMLTNVAIASIELGELAAGIAALEDALAIHRASLGETAPSVAQDHQNLGSALRVAGRIDEALAHQQRALELREQLFGRDDPRVAASLVGVANVLEDDLQRPRDALALRQRAAAIDEATYGAEHPQLTLGLANLAHNLLVVGERVAARETATRAHRLAAAPAVAADTRQYAALVLARVLADDPPERGRARALLDAAKASATGPDIDGAARELIAATEAALAR